MQCLIQQFGRAVLLGAILTLTAPARAETCSLELKRLDSTDTSANNIYRNTYPQHFQMQWAPEGSKTAVLHFYPSLEEFQKLVKKEPKYQSAHPFRGIIKLGTRKYAFALDFIPPEPATTEKQPQPPKEGELKEGEKIESGQKEKSANAEPEAIGFNRFYFDSNGNGDLTDDKVIEPDEKQRFRAYRRLDDGRSYASFMFPRIDVTIDVAGTPLEYAFFLYGNMQVSKDFCYAGVQLNSAVYREGEITLDGKRRHVVLLDFNSNGCFNDAVRIRGDIRIATGQVYPEQGDRLKIDLDPEKPVMESPYNVNDSKSWNHVSKLVDIGGQFYDVEISPAGDRLTLTPSSLPLGSVTNPNGPFSAVVYGERGFLKISGSPEKPAALPEGEWKLLNYKMDRTGMKEPPEAAKTSKDSTSDAKQEKAESTAAGKSPQADRPSGTTPKKKESLLESIAKKAKELSSGRVPPGSRYRHTIVAGDATDKYPSIKVVKGENVELPFGPPFKPVVRAYSSGKGQMHLELSLIGAGGEICTNMMVDGSRPPKPKFTITDPDGKIVHQGDFEYG